MAKKRRLLRELGWFAAGFVLPFAVLIAIDVLTRPSPLPLGRRLLTLEDTCAYGICFVIPAVVYLAVLLMRRVVGAKSG